jgi:hypothetical protein
LGVVRERRATENHTLADGENGIGPMIRRLRLVVTKETEEWNLR